MDPRTSAQDLMRCDLCKTAMIQMYCDTCLVKMCKACVGEHFSTDFSKPHKIMDFKDRKSTPLYPGCTSHDKERCEMYCDQCDISICSKCVVSGKHSSHKIITILQAYTTKKEKVLKNKTELNETIFPAYQDIASDLEKRIRQLGKEYGDLSTAITKHGEDCHREIDKLVQKLNAEAEEMKTTQLHTLQKQLEEVKRKISDIKDEISSMDAALDTNDTSELFNATFNVGEYKKLPQKIVPSVPKFTPWRVQGKFCKLFGTLSSISVPSKEHGYSIKTTQKSPEAASPSTQQHMPVSQQVPGRPQGGHLKVPAAPNRQTGYKGYGANQMMKWPQSQNPGMQQAPPQAVIVQRQDPLTPTMLATAPPQEQKQMLGERLFPLISQIFPDLAGKITGMLLEIDNSELLHMLESQESLEAKVIEAVAVLQAHQAKESATTTNIHWQYK